MDNPELIAQPDRYDLIEWHLDVIWQILFRYRITYFVTILTDPSVLVSKLLYLPHAFTLLKLQYGIIIQYLDYISLKTVSQYYGNIQYMAVILLTSYFGLYNFL